MTFPGDFVWGVSTSAFQIEGGRHEHGKGESIWDRFLPDTALGPDHVHRWREDVALMAELGVGAYRFSIAWTRVLPDGSGEVNPAGLGFYDRLIDELLSAGLQPWPTLYHWDLPQALQDRGGWPARATVDAFVRFVDVTTAALGDRVSHWITHNEPWVAAFAGHLEGVHAPGLRDWRAALAAAHHLLLSHGRAVPVIRANAPGSQVGIALDCRASLPASERQEDRAARRHFDGFRNRWFFDPVFGRGYPADMVEAYGRRGRFGRSGPAYDHPGDQSEMGPPLDFLGLNYYTRLLIGPGQEESEDTGVPPGPHPPPGHTEMGWPITPDALTDFLERLRRDYHPPQIVITENGASFGDGPGPDGAVHDQRRIDYLRHHLVAVAAAIERGVPVAGYFAWSLLDNLEWTHGYDQRFGLVWVDHHDGRRVPKDSFDWYRRVIASGGATALH